jgi:hypothetical protein
LSGYRGSYRSPVLIRVWWTIIVLADLALLAYLISAVLTLAPAGVAGMAVLIVVLLVPLNRSAFVGLRFETPGVTVMNPVRTIRVPWEEIDRFELMSGSGKTRLVKTDRKSIYIWGVQQWGWATAFGLRDTPERAWVDEWNAMLAERRSTATAS